jgi:hypothetical protein
MQMEYVLTEVDGIGQMTAERLHNAGITSVEQLATMDTEKLAEMKGFGDSSAKKLISAAKMFLQEKGQEKISSAIHRDSPQGAQKIVEKANPADSGNQQNKFELLLKLSTEKSHEVPLEQDIEEDISYSKELEGNIRYADNITEVLRQEKNKLQVMKNMPTTPYSGTAENIHKTDFISQNTVKSQEDLNGLPVMDYENHLYLQLNGEKLDRREVSSLQQHLIETLKSQGYHMIPKNCTLLRTISREIDLLAIKILPVNPLITVLHICPIKISLLRGHLIIREKALNYEPLNHEISFEGELENHYFTSPIEHFITTQYALLHHILSGKVFFGYLKKLVPEGLSVQKTRGHRQLYLFAEQKEYKIIIDPIFITFSEPKFLEKSLTFPYQIDTNLHIISYVVVDQLLAYLQKKYHYLENREPSNSIIRYRNFSDKIFSQMKNVSIPFVVVGILLLFMMWFTEGLILDTVSRLGIAALSIYGIVLGFFYLSFFKTQKEMIHQCNQPYFRKLPPIDENDLMILRDELSTKVLDQLIYECVGKKASFSVMDKIEQEKAQQLDEELVLYHENEAVTSEPLGSSSSSGSEQEILRKKMVSKYSKFLED